MARDVLQIVNKMKTNQMGAHSFMILKKGTEQMKIDKKRETTTTKPPSTDSQLHHRHINKLFRVIYLPRY